MKKRAIGLKLPLPAIRLRHRIKNQTGGKRQGAEKHQRRGENRSRETRHNAGSDELMNDRETQRHSNNEKQQRDQGKEPQGSVVLESVPTIATTLMPSDRVFSFDSDPSGRSR